jgi:hypothetical protein
MKGELGTMHEHSYTRALLLFCSCCSALSLIIWAPINIKNFVVKSALFMTFFIVLLPLSFHHSLCPVVACRLDLMAEKNLKMCNKEQDTFPYKLAHITRSWLQIWAFETAERGIRAFGGGSLTSCFFSSFFNKIYIDYLMCFLQKSLPEVY